jgi:hypothetical protein
MALSNLLHHADFCIPLNDVYRFALHPNDFPAFTLSVTAGSQTEHLMDEPVRLLTVGRRRDKRWISTRPSYQLQLDLGEALRLRKLRVAYQPRLSPSLARTCKLRN